MPTYISLDDIEDRLPEIIDRVVHHRERFVLMRGGEPLAELLPVRNGRRLSELPGIFAALPRLGAAEAESFGRDIDTARDELNAVASRDPWQS